MDHHHVQIFVKQHDTRHDLLGAAHIDSHQYRHLEFGSHHLSRCHNLCDLIVNRHEQRITCPDQFLNRFRERHGDRIPFHLFILIHFHHGLQHPAGNTNQCVFEFTPSLHVGFCFRTHIFLSECFRIRFHDSDRFFVRSSISFRKCSSEWESIGIRNTYGIRVGLVHMVFVGIGSSYRFIIRNSYSIGYSFWDLLGNSVIVCKDHRVTDAFRIP